MSRTLTFIHAAWSSVQSLANEGRRREAIEQARRLLRRCDLTTAVAVGAHRLAGELLLESERYPKARRHLLAAAKLMPTHARTHYLIGLAYENDPLGDDRRAAMRYGKACELEPKNALYTACFGRAAIRCDRIKRGVRTMIAAAKMAPADMNVIRVAIGGLLEAGRMTAAKRVLETTRFLAPANRELEQLQNRVRFESARRQQSTWVTQDARIATDGAVSILPFVRLVGTPKRTGAGRGTIRMDSGSSPRPHLLRLRGLKADR